MTLSAVMIDGKTSESMTRLHAQGGVNHCFRFVNSVAQAPDDARDRSIGFRALRLYSIRVLRCCAPGQNISWAVLVTWERSPYIEISSTTIPGRLRAGAAT